MIFLNLFTSSDNEKRSSISSISSFFPSLKRKRSQEDEGDEEEEVVNQKIVTRMIQKLRPKKKNCRSDRNQPAPLAPIWLSSEDALYKFQHEFTLPVIEYTDGKLGIDMKEEEDSIFSMHGSCLEFPVPPRKRRSCPPPIVMQEEDSASEYDLPLTPIDETTFILNKIYI